jgi:membrane protein DedA with SNARE-associated domain
MHHLMTPSAMTEQLAVWGYWGLFLFVFIGNLGVPMPEETVLLVAGFLAGRGDLDLSTVYLVGISSAIVGDSCGFMIGRTGGQRLLERLAGRFKFVRSRFDRLQEFFHAHGSKAVFMARFVTGARFLAGPMAGAAGMPFWRFLGWNMLGALIWCSLVITVGYLLGNELDWVAHVLHRASHWVALVMCVVLAALWIFWFRYRSQPRPES